MNIREAIEKRHSVREYKDTPIPGQVRAELDKFTAKCNAESGLSISIRYDDPEGFDSRLAHYGNFRNVKNYIILAGKKDGDFDLRCGYYGEKIVLYAQGLGLNTCWAALTFNKGRVKKLVPQGCALCMVIALGYGTTQGVQHKGKSYTDVTTQYEIPRTVEDAPQGQQPIPDWFKAGVKAALLAPTAVNQQKFVFSYEDGRAKLRSKGLGTCLKVDLGIVKYHFEIVSGHEAVVV